MDRTDYAHDGKNYLMSREEDVQRDWSCNPYGSSETRPQLLQSLEKKILEYSELLLKASQLNGLEKPSQRDYRSVLRYMEQGGQNGGGQLYEGEMSWVYEKEDLVTLRPGREHAWLDGRLERLLKVCRGRIVRYIFCTP
ncbi:MAG: hypothetical protein LQ338_007262, partial [Usnochroma carphineum]